MSEVREYPEWPVEAVDALVQGMSILDMNKKGVGRHQLRALYPSIGWNDLQKGLDAALAAGKITSKKIRVDGAKVAVEHFFVKES